MKKDLITAIGTAIVGLLIAFFVTNLLVKPADPVTFKTVDSKVSSDIQDPSPDMFNYLSLNPTVEVYVGDCTETNEFGECVKSGNVTVVESDEDSKSKTNNANSSSANTNNNENNANTDNNKSTNTNTEAPENESSSTEENE